MPQGLHDDVVHRLLSAVGDEDPGVVGEGDPGAGGVDGEQVGTPEAELPQIELLLLAVREGEGDAVQLRAHHETRRRRLHHRVQQATALGQYGLPAGCVLDDLRVAAVAPAVELPPGHDRFAVDGAQRPVLRGPLVGSVDRTPVRSTVTTREVCASRPLRSSATTG
ncbi:hypothetical protein ACRJ4W_45430 [Streptomyces sp. GLT-R25]